VVAQSEKKTCEQTPEWVAGSGEDDGDDATDADAAKEESDVECEEDGGAVEDDVEDDGTENESEEEDASVVCSNRAGLGCFEEVSITSVIATSGTSGTPTPFVREHMQIFNHARECFEQFVTPRDNCNMTRSQFLAFARAYGVTAAVGAAHLDIIYTRVVGRPWYGPNGIERRSKMCLDQFIMVLQQLEQHLEGGVSDHGVRKEESAVVEGTKVGTKTKEGQHANVKAKAKAKTKAKTKAKMRGEAKDLLFKDLPLPLKLLQGPSSASKKLRKYVLLK
jgi:hypothetical protein